MVTLVAYVIDVKGAILVEILDHVRVQPSRLYNLPAVLLHAVEEVQRQGKSGCNCKNYQVEVDSQLSSFYLVEYRISVQLRIVKSFQTLSLHNLASPQFTGSLLASETLVHVE